MSSSNNTLERIQREIRESIQREKELKKHSLTLIGESAKYKEVSHNGISKLKLEQKNDIKIEQTNGNSNINGFTRRFIPNTSTKGVMQKFFKSRGKVDTISDSNGYSPVKFRVKKGQAIRNGYVPAEEKIVKELLDFQIRESELRSERMKSQPDLMAALELEENQLNNGNGSVLKSAKSMTNLFQCEDNHKNDYSLPSR